ncbi:hypothetical protein M3Y97_00678000 [Aphelenchoides bicaudatus]|nr:hypothetical protein M3Y97_00678000 [Aphelenchoides bicaudatus]
MSNSPPSESASSAEEHSHNGENEGDQAKRGVELASRVLNVDKKRFYVDVKQNDRGRFVQIVALLSGGRKSRVILALSVAKKLIGLLEKVPSIEASEYPKTLGRLTSGKRVYFVDLKSNEHGSFVRLTQTLSRVPKRFSVFIPVEGIKDLCKLLTELSEEFGDGDEKEVQLPPSQQLRDVRNKMFYFDCNSNDFGDYLRITETRFSSDNRTSITVSLKNLQRFHEILGELLNNFKELRAADANAEPAAPETPAA